MVHPTSRIARTSPMWVLGRAACIAAFAIGGLWVFALQLATLDVDVLSRTVLSFAPHQWLLSIVCTFVSFWAVGRYDVIAHRVLRTNLPAGPAQISGMAAIAVGQSIGIPSIVSAFVRWRALPNCDPKIIAKVSGFVALGFSGCWALMALAALWALAGHSGIGLPRPQLVIPLCLVVAVQLIRIGQKSDLPGPVLVRLMGWACADVVFAALALFVFLPEMAGPTAASFIAIYVIALGAGIFANTPGGVGVFEAVLLALLPTIAPTELVAAILAYRMTYYILPLIAGAGVLLRPIAAQKGAFERTSYRRQEHLIAQGPGTWALARQSGSIWEDPTLAVHMLRPPGALVACAPAQDAVIDTEALRRTARRHQCLSAIYQCSARQAVMLREKGWQVARVASRADIHLPNWHLDRPAHKRLRRKLRQAEKAGVTARMADPKAPLPRAEMHRIARRWTRRQGGAMGVTMGQYDGGYVARQRVILIEVDGRLRGFVTFFHDAQCWTLDLIRTESDLPQGAVHLAVVTAINAALAQNLSTLSLANVPHDAGWVGKAAKGRGGLAQFKRCFDPRWTPLYYAAPGKLSLLATAISLTWAIHHPPKPPRLS